MKIKIEEKTIRSLPFQTTGQSYYFDTKMTGFGLCVGNKSKTFFLQRTINHKTKRITLGRFDEINCTQARMKAQETAVQLHQGNHPIHSKKQDKTFQSYTLSEVSEHYSKCLLAQNKTASFGEYPLILKRHFLDWLDKPISYITRDKVIERHQQITINSGPSIANKAFRMLRAFFNYLNVEDETILNPIKILSLRKLWNKEIGKTSWIKKTQIKDWMNTCLSLPNDITRYLLLFVLLNGLRKSEALSLKWDDIDLGNKSFTIKITKNKKPHSLPLTTHTEALLQVLKQYRINEYVFPSSTSVSGHLVEPRKSVEYINDTTGTDITIHDLRRTFTSTATLLNISPYTTKKLLNHSLGNDVTALYIRGDVEDLRNPLQLIQDQLLSLSEITSEQILSLTLHPSSAFSKHL